MEAESHGQGAVACAVWDGAAWERRHLGKAVFGKGGISLLLELFFIPRVGSLTHPCLGESWQEDKHRWALRSDTALPAKAELVCFSSKLMC